MIRTNEIADYVTENKGGLVSANLEVLIEKNKAYSVVIADIEHKSRNCF